MKRFAPELNRYFGKGNWKCISSETTESFYYKGILGLPGKFKEWNIS
jgi:hypothetical protein